jgi:hypothetical protein
LSLYEPPPQLLTMIELLERIWQNLLERTTGPMHFRFILQPTMAMIFAVRAALRDVKNKETPYLRRLKESKGNRKAVVKEGWKDVGKVFALAMTLDIAYQLVVIFGQKTETRFYILESILVALVLSIIPYLLLRGPVSRLVRFITGKIRKAETE